MLTNKTDNWTERSRQFMRSLVGAPPSKEIASDAANTQRAFPGSWRIKKGRRRPALWEDACVGRAQALALMIEPTVVLLSVPPAALASVGAAETDESPPPW